MFMAAISNWLEMGFASSRRLTAASRSTVPFSSPVRASAALDAGSDAGAAEEAGALEEEPPQPVSRAAQRAKTAIQAKTLRFIISSFSFSLVL